MSMFGVPAMSRLTTISKLSDPRRAQFRSLIEAFYRVHAFTEDGPEIEETEEALSRFVDRIEASPVCTMADLVLRADVARYAADRWGQQSNADDLRTLTVAIARIAGVEAVTWKQSA